MSVVLKVIVVLLGVVNLSNTKPCIGSSRWDLFRLNPNHDYLSPRWDRFGTFPDHDYWSWFRNLQLPEEQDTSRNYTYTPGIGSHKVHTRVASWNSARLTCEKEGGHLAIINSIAELDVLRRLFNESGIHRYAQDVNHVHIGIHELYHDNEWVTIHGESLTDAGFDIWAPGEPSHAYNNTEHCGSMCRGGKLNDIGCHKRIGFICEKPDIVTPAPSDQQAQIHPRFGSTTERNDYTYTPNIGAHKVHTQATNWNSARKICKEEGGHLAIINSAAESELIARLVANSGSHNGSTDFDYVLVGFHDLFAEGQFVTVNGKSIEETGFNEWADGSPSNGPAIQEDCGSIYKNGKLNDVSCVHPYGFVCELPHLPPNLQRPEVESAVPSNLVSY